MEGSKNNQKPGLKAVKTLEETKKDASLILNEV